MAYEHSWTETGSFGVGTFSHAISGLSPGTTYKFKGKAHNPSGWAYAGDLTFTTKPQPPTSFVATASSTTQIHLTWTKGTGAVSTVIRRSTTYYPSDPTDGDGVYNGIGSSTSDIGLTAGTLYYYAAWSYTNPNYSDDAARDKEKIVVSASVTTDSSSNITETTANINGTLVNDGGENCDCGFQWGLTITYGTATSTESKSTGETFSTSLSGLTHNTTYHFRAFATNYEGTIYGKDLSFMTNDLSTVEEAWISPALLLLLQR